MMSENKERQGMERKAMYRIIFMVVEANIALGLIS